MANFNLSFPQQVIHEIIVRNQHFPNNHNYPFLIYKQAIHFVNSTPQDIQKLLAKNHWLNSWVNSIYDYHHYHSNTHETLVIYAGQCKVEIGGEHSKIFEIEEGDVIIFPAGVSHKKVESSESFKCIGAYPFGIDYDMNYGKAEEHPCVDQNIKLVGLPKADPIFGENGLLFDYWK